MFSALEEFYAAYCGSTHNKCYVIFIFCHICVGNYASVASIKKESGERQKEREKGCSFSLFVDDTLAYYLYIIFNSVVSLFISTLTPLTLKKRKTAINQLFPPLHPIPKCSYIFRNSLRCRGVNSV